MHFIGQKPDENIGHHNGMKLWWKEFFRSQVTAFGTIQLSDNRLPIPGLGKRFGFNSADGVDIVETDG
jgi:hypothetical protein